METLRFHLRSAVRTLARRPALTAVAVLTLALGIGANTAVFSVLRGVLLRPFPFESPERLVVVWETSTERGLDRMYAAPPNFDDWRREADSLAAAAAFAPATYVLSPGEGTVTEVRGARVTANLFDVLGVAPLHGRTFTAADDRPGAAPTVLLSHGLWARRYGADPGVVGSAIDVDGDPHRVVGVLPDGFVFPPAMALEGTAPAESAALWVPLGYGASEIRAMSRGARHLTVVARLAAGASAAAAEAELRGLADSLAREYPDTNDGWSVTVAPLVEEMVGPITPSLWLLTGAVVLVLLIACVNVANLLLATATDRRRELAVRRALGAGFGRLAGQMLAESLLLGLAGGALGLLLAGFAVDLLVHLAPAGVPRLHEVALDGAVMAFAAGLSALAGLLFGVVPVLRLAREGRGSVVLSGATATAGRGEHRLGGLLVVAEVALAFVLLVGAGLLVESFLRLRGVDPGFEPARVLTVRTTLPGTAYPDRPERATAYRRLREEVLAVPGVRQAGFVVELPLDADRQGTTVSVEGEVIDEVEGQVNFTFATPGYFEAMDVTVREGRGFEEADRAEAEPVAVVNRAFARRLLGGESPVGRQVHLGFDEATGRRVVGVVDDVLHDALGREPFPAVYVPYAQLPYTRRLALAVRTELDPSEALGAVTARLRRVEPGLAVSDPRTMEEIVGVSIATPRFVSLLLGAFAGVALILAVVGVYGVLAHGVHRRTREIGVRVALGADRRGVLGLVLRRGMAPVVVGLGIGVLAALALRRLVEGFLFGVGSADPVLYAALALLLTATALAACLVPARRAVAVDPKVALEES